MVLIQIRASNVATCSSELLRVPIVCRHIQPRVRLGRCEPRPARSTHFPQAPNPVEHDNVRKSRMPSLSVGACSSFSQNGPSVVNDGSCDSGIREACTKGYLHLTDRHVDDVLSL